MGIKYMSRITVIIKSHFSSTCIHIMDSATHARFVELVELVNQAKSSLEIHCELLDILHRTSIRDCNYISVAFDVVKTIVEDDDSYYSEYNKFAVLTFKQLSELKKDELIELLNKCAPRSLQDDLLVRCLNNEDILTSKAE